MKTVKGQQGLSPVYVHAGLAVLAVLFAYSSAFFRSSQG